MGRRGDHSKEELAAMALDAAIELLEAEGPDRLTTRAVAGRIGYAAGSLYFVFRNRDDLILQVNGRTLDELRAALDQGLAGCTHPRSRLLALGRTYLRFASDHIARWRLIFEHDLPDPRAVPADLQTRIDGLFTLVGEQLALFAPGLDREGVRRGAQALWCGVHGIAVLAVTDKLWAGGKVDAEELTADLIERYLAGLAADGGGSGWASGRMRGG